MNYSEDTIDPSYEVGFGISFGGDAPTSGNVNAQVSGGAAAAACPGCAQARLLGGMSLPLILIALAVVVLAFRR